MTNMSDLKVKRQAASGERETNKFQVSSLKFQASSFKSQASSFKPQVSSFKFQPAFTLLEVMVAVSIMAIVLVAVYRLHAQTIAMSNASRFYTTAPLLAQRTIANIGIGESVELGGGSGDFGEEFPGYTWELSIEDTESEVLDETIVKDLKKIDVTVNLNNGEFVYGFRTYQFVEEK